MLNQPDFYEYVQFEKILKKQSQQKNIYWNFEILDQVISKGTAYPLWKVTCENNSSCLQSEEKTTLILIGGVHGLEKIGSQLCVSLIEKYFELSNWDSVFQNQLKNIRLVFFPFVNPAGIQQRTRCNPQGIDLMRNAPVDSEESVPFLAGGHRLSSRLPWYRGPAHEKMQLESDTVTKAISTEIQKSKMTLSLDIHSGFGFKDQIWFPWAYSKKPFPHLSTITEMTGLFEKIYPFHIYTIEPQSKVYCTHGDLWDYLALRHSNYIPLTLELGSWIWVKKNPLQLLNIDGLFNPIKQHRIKRTLRRHQLLIDFLIRFLLYRHINEFKNNLSIENHKKGLKKWYPHLTA